LAAEQAERVAELAAERAAGLAEGEFPEQQVGLLAERLRCERSSWEPRCSFLEAGLSAWEHMIGGAAELAAEEAA